MGLGLSDLNVTSLEITRTRLRFHINQFIFTLLGVLEAGFNVGGIALFQLQDLLEQIQNLIIDVLGDLPVRHGLNKTAQYLFQKLHLQTQLSLLQAASTLPTLYLVDDTDQSQRGEDNHRENKKKRYHHQYTLFTKKLLMIVITGYIRSTRNKT